MGVVKPVPEFGAALFASQKVGVVGTPPPEVTSPFEEVEPDALQQLGKKVEPLPPKPCHRVGDPFEKDSLGVELGCDILCRPFKTVPSLERKGLFLTRRHSYSLFKNF